MRLLLNLESTVDAAYDREYYHKFQGLIYNCLKQTHQLLHDKEGYKFFCFSNIFPIGDMKTGDRRKLIVSSPDNSIIKALNTNLPETIKVGEYKFQILSKNTINVKLKDKSILKTPTPIVVRIPRRNYSKYMIESDREYVYWRPQYPVSVFLKQLEENLLKKYSEYVGEQFEIPLVFEDMMLINNPATFTYINNSRVQVVGSTWEFNIGRPTPDQRRLLEFSIDCGFGELNTLGYGFINPT